MKRDRTFELDFTHPYTEITDFDYRLDDVFFQSIDQNVVLGGDLDLHIQLKPLPNKIYDLTLQYDGIVDVPCDRCLAPMELDVEIDESLQIKIGDELNDTDDELIVLDATKPVYDFKWVFFELLALHLPLQKAHDIAECDPEMLHYLVSEAPKEMPLEEQEQMTYNGEQDMEIDPRWAKLFEKNK